MGTQRAKTRRMKMGGGAFSPWERVGVRAGVGRRRQGLEEGRPRRTAPIRS
jgi:hypothetical protein